MPKYLVELEDGRKFHVEADAPPSSQEVIAYLQTQNVVTESQNSILRLVTGKTAQPLIIAFFFVLFLWLLKTVNRWNQFKMSTQARKLFVLLFLTPLCLFVAGYCYTAVMAPGGWHLTREGEPSYTRPSHYSREFYEGLRWSVMIVGGLMAIIARKCKEKGACVIYWAVAALFNPVFPIHMDKSIWHIIDALAGLVFLGAPTVAWPRNVQGESQTQIE